MKKLIFLLLVGWMIPAAAQNQKTVNADKLIEKKLDFLRERLLLDDTQFRAFAPVFRRYETQRMALARQRHDLVKDLRKERLSQLSDADVSHRLDRILEIDEKMFLLKKEYYRQLKKILPPRKILALVRADNQFRRLLLQRRRHRAMERREHMHGMRRGPAPGRQKPAGPQNPVQ